MGCVSHVAETVQRRGAQRGAGLLPAGARAQRGHRPCGSSQQAVHFAAQAVMSGTRDV